ncbi:energy transducer TonB [Vogesella facilis]|uniref:Energy transducer TonB n=1 Tax=Vogesella facilis TaxID=1655232 RepID=A0ABV7RAZ9_9NEIS
MLGLLCMGCLLWLSVAAAASPSYPAASLAARESGTVVCLVNVDENGKVIEATIRQSSRFPRLDEAALAWVRTLAFVPASNLGQAVPASYVLPVAFSLPPGQ